MSTSQPSAPALLIVDDDPMVIAALARVLAPRFHVHTAAGVDEALALLEELPPLAAILCDIHMPDGTGLDLRARVMQRGRHDPRRFIFMTGDRRNEATAAGLEAVQNQCLLKPLATDMVLRAISTVMAPSQAEASEPLSSEAFETATTAQVRQLRHDLRSPLTTLQLLLETLLDAPTDAEDLESTLRLMLGAVQTMSRRLDSP